MRSFTRACIQTVLAVTVAACLGLAAPAVAKRPVPPPPTSENPVSTLPSNEFLPQVDANRILWFDKAAGSTKVRDMVTGETQEIAGVLGQEGGRGSCDPVLSGNRIVWTDQRSLFVYDLISGETSTVATDARIQHPVISGSRIVWGGEFVDEYHPVEIKMLDLTDGSVRVIGHLGLWIMELDDADIHGNLYVWCDGSVHAVNLDTGEQWDAAGWSPQQSVAVSGGRMVFLDCRSQNNDVFVYDFATRTSIQLTHDSIDQEWCDIWGDTVVWSQVSNENVDVFAYDLDTGETRRVTADAAHQTKPAIGACGVAWEDYRNGYSDIYWSPVSALP